MNESILQAEKISKTFTTGDKTLRVLKEISFSIHRGTTCAIVGPSGSGKTTLLGICAGLDTPTDGSVYLNGQDISSLPESKLATIRNEQIGFVFQSFQLISTLTALENVMVPVELRGVPYREVEKRALELLKEVGLEDRVHHYPAQLSGGEQQRVGLARAYMHQPDILFADEPTGNLDGETGNHIESLLFDLNRVQGTTLVIVTHDRELAMKCSRVIELKNGEIYADYSPAENEAAEKPAINAELIR
ncbi:MAG: ABC transporter ATP-binding protein [Balneolaceae bacterium]